MGDPRRANVRIAGDLCFPGLKGQLAGVLFAAVGALWTGCAAPAPHPPAPARDERIVTRRAPSEPSQPRRRTASPAPARVAPQSAVARPIGRSVEGRTIERFDFGGGSATILIFGGIHGDEPTSPHVARQLIQTLQAGPLPPSGVRVVVVPAVNPDGLARGSRSNARGVDLNRNFPAANWKRRGAKHGSAPLSEPESAALAGLVEELRPCAIVSIHSITGGRECNNYDGPGEWLARTMSRLNGYPPRATIGYPTPGSFGTWAGAERGIPVLTLELPAAASGEVAWRSNREALLSLIRAAGAAPQAGRGVRDVRAGGQGSRGALPVR